MRKLILPIFSLFFFSLANAADVCNSAQQESAEPAKKHWHQLNKYMLTRGCRDTCLVVEVGQFDPSIPLLTQSSDDDFLHLTILNGGGGSQFFPDIDSFLGWDIPFEAKGAFNEVHIRRGQRGRENFYSILFGLLRPNGRLFDYRSTSQDLHEKETKIQIRRELEGQGFAEIRFGLKAGLSLPDELISRVICALKPEIMPLSAAMLLSAPVDDSARQLEDAFLVQTFRDARRAEQLALTPVPPERPQPRISVANISRAAFRVCRRYFEK